MTVSATYILALLSLPTETRQI